MKVRKGSQIFNHIHSFGRNHQWWHILCSPHDTSNGHGSEFILHRGPVRSLAVKQLHLEVGIGRDDIVKHLDQGLGSSRRGQVTSEKHRVDAMFPVASEECLQVQQYRARVQASLEGEMTSGAQLHCAKPISQHNQ